MFLSRSLKVFFTCDVLTGALAATPLDLILPIMMSLSVHKLDGCLRHLNLFLIWVCAAVGLVGTSAALHSIAQNASTYSLFANLGVLENS